jgi:uncharacterized membrane protein
MSTSQSSPPSNEQEKETGRVEAFSDGVFAIAITLLVLELKVPRELGEGVSLAQALLSLWPSYLALVTSFATIGVMWINHHKLFTLITRTDDVLLILNALLLLGITVSPFPTSLVAEYIQKPEGFTAAIVYNGLFILIAIAFNILWRYASGGRRLLKRDADEKAIKAIDDAYRLGPLFYVVALAVAFVSVPLSVVLNLGIAIFFGWPRQRYTRPAR